MTLKIRLFGNLRYLRPDHQEMITLETAEPIAIPDLVQQLGLPREEVYMVAINGLLAQEGQQARPGDEIELFTAVAGGGDPRQAES